MEKKMLLAFYLFIFFFFHSNNIFTRFIPRIFRLEAEYHKGLKTVQISVTQDTS